nr:MAG TPA: hypothetical protein [Caudoviricetes sp.]
MIEFLPCFNICRLNSLGIKEWLKIPSKNF